MNIKYNPLMIAAMKSGAGKTSITYSIIRALFNMNKSISTYKTGPDYIDTMYHKIAGKRECINLDPFFLDEKGLKEVFEIYRENTSISIIEAAMGLYNGIHGMEPLASAYSVAKAIAARIILIVTEEEIQGLDEYINRYDASIIKGVILNKIQKNKYNELKQVLEDRNIKVYGYIPYDDNLIIPSRHLGLTLPVERENIDKKMDDTAKLILKTVDIFSILEDIKYNEVCELPQEQNHSYNENIYKGEYNLAISYDKAFCFLYHDNIKLLEKHGAKIIFFSPLYDKALPDNIDGLWLIGGYPEIYAKELSENIEMKNSIKTAIEGGMPTIAECGGFMYLHKFMEGKDSKLYKLCGVFNEKAVNTNKLSRFGYIEVRAKEDNLLLSKDESMRSHEFHYWDSSYPGESHIAKKANKSKEWNCIVSDENIFAGFPHIYLRSNINMAGNFSKACLNFKYKKINQRDL